MADYTELVKSLRICASEPSCEGCKNHVADEQYELFNSCTSGAETLMKEAADAIEELLKAAKKMHTWIFLNTVDEQKAYDECGLSDEMNATLGYGGSFEISVPKEETK